MQITPSQFSSIVDALTVVLPLVSPADVSLKFYFRQHPKLGVRDRAVVAETIYSVLRHRRVLETLIVGGHPRLLALGALTRFSSMGLRDVLKLASQADHPLLEKIKALDLSTLPFAVRTELPDWVLARLSPWMSEEEIMHLALSLQHAAPLDLRVNTIKAKREAVLQAFAQEGIDALPTAISPMGVRLKGKPALNKHALFLNGSIEIQDEGSQVLGLLMEAKRGEMVADFCAGAGGKTLLLGAQMASTGRLYAFDVSEKRLANLSPRLKRSGLSNVMAQRIESENDTRIKRLAGKLDRVLVDAPCTGLGTLRRNPDLKYRQSEKGLGELNVKQAAILASAGRLVKPGGRLVYATCSFLREENEDIIAAFLTANPHFTIVPAHEVLDSARLKVQPLQTGDFMRLYPHIHHVDGFFAAVMVRGAAEPKAAKPAKVAADETTNDETPNAA